jgi:hypothetical protein
MRSPSSTTLTMLTSMGLIVASLAFSNAAMAAGTGANPAHKSGVGAPKHRLAQSLCARPLRFSAEQLVPAVLSLPLVPGPNDSLNIDGVRVPIGDCGPAEIDPYTGAAIDNRPTTSGSAWIARMKQNGGAK